MNTWHGLSFFGLWYLFLLSFSQSRFESSGTIYFVSEMPILLVPDCYCVIMWKSELINIHPLRHFCSHHGHKQTEIAAFSFIMEKLHHQPPLCTVVIGCCSLFSERVYFYTLCRLAGWTHWQYFGQLLACIAGVTVPTCSKHLMIW